MAEYPYPFQPGAILHDAIVAAFRASNSSFESWLAERGIPSATARGATYGQSRGPKGTAILNDLIDAAGPELVWGIYVNRLRNHVSDVNERVA